MTLTVEDDFREFLAARWPDLEAVAFLVTLDPATARRVATQAFATLHQRWGQALAEGSPGAMARRAVLAAAVAAAPAVPPPPCAATTSGGPDAPQPQPPPPSDAVGSVEPWRGPDDDDDDPVRTALVAAVRASTPLERALVGARSVWAAGPDEVADLLGMPVADVGERAAALRGRLLAAHDAARAADGLEPADWALDGDLDSVVAHLLTGQGEPPDPGALVEERRRSVRRRVVVAGGAAALSAGAVAWWLRSAPVTTASSAPLTASRAELPRPDNASWGSASRWSARGRLATDPRVLGLVVSRWGAGSRLLYADDIAGHRLVVASTSGPGTEDVMVRAWQGPSGAEPAGLLEVPLENSSSEGRDVVGVVLPEPPGALLLVLARPPMGRAEYSPSVRPTKDGTILRRWVAMRLEAGIGATRLTDRPGPAVRVRCAGFDGAPVGPVRTRVGRGGTDALAGFDEETRRFVAAATGQSLDVVRTRVVLDGKVGGGVLDPRAFSAQGGDGRVQVLRTTTGHGAVVRSVRVVDDGRSDVSWYDAEPPTVLPASTPRDEPVVVRLDDSRPGVGRFLVIAPGAARVQLLSTSPNAYPVSKVTATRAGVAIVEVVNANDASAFRLVRRDARGELVGDGVPRAGKDLLDLRSGEQTLVM